MWRCGARTIVKKLNKPAIAFNLIYSLYRIKILGNALIFSMNSAKLMTTYSSVAQSVERVAVNHHVVGSSPARGAIFFLVICSFQHVIGWKLRKIVRDSMPSPKPDSFYDDVMQVLSLAPSIYTKSKNLKNWKNFFPKRKKNIKKWGKVFRKLTGKARAKVLIKYLLAGVR